MTLDPRAEAALTAHPHPLLFATVSGAHLYGFPSADSDIDLRGVHVLPVRDVLGLDPGNETVEVSETREGLEIDLVTHDVRKFILLLLKKNGYVLEQLYSPIVARTSPEHEELKALAGGCITRHHAHHYLGFLKTEWGLFLKDRGVKRLLYAYRVLLTGIHLMRTGQIEANLERLNDGHRLTYLPELIRQKREGREKEVLPDADVEFHRHEIERLTQVLEEASAASHLPERPTAREALNDLLIRVRRTHGQ